MPGPQVSGPINTTAPSDVFGTHYSVLGVGGHHEVATIAARNAITNERRHHGMTAFVQSDSTFWVLDAAPWNGTDSDWTLLELGAGGVAESQEFHFPTPVTSWTMNHSLGGYPAVQTMDLSRAEFEADVSYPSTSQVIVDFDVPGGVSGYGILRNS